MIQSFEKYKIPFLQSAFSCLVLFFIVSCSSDVDIAKVDSTKDIVVLPGTEQISLSLGASNDIIKVGTRATSSDEYLYPDLQSYGEVGLFVIDELAWKDIKEGKVVDMNSRGYGYENIHAMIGTDGSIIPDEQLFYPYGRRSQMGESGEEDGRLRVAIVAYAPYNPSLTWSDVIEGTQVNLPFNQEDAVSLAKQDFSIGHPMNADANQTVRLADGEAVPLMFRHALSHIDLNVSFDAEIAEDYEGVEIRMHNVYVNGGYDIKYSTSLWREDSDYSTIIKYNSLPSTDVLMARYSVADFTESHPDKGIIVDGSTVTLKATSLVLPRCYTNDTDNQYYFTITLTGKPTADAVDTEDKTMTGTPDFTRYPKLLTLRPGSNYIFGKNQSPDYNESTDVDEEDDFQVGGIIK